MFLMRVDCSEERIKQRVLRHFLPLSLSFFLTLVIDGTRKKQQMTHHAGEELANNFSKREQLRTRKRPEACLRCPRHHKDLYQVHIFKRQPMASPIRLANSISRIFGRTPSHHKMHPKVKARRSPSKSNRPDR